VRNADRLRQAHQGQPGRQPVRFDPIREHRFSATPTCYLIDHKGVIRYKWAGPPGDKVMDAALDKLIEAAEGNGKNTAR
jgi:hypothetical protein